MKSGIPVYNGFSMGHWMENALGDGASESDTEMVAGHIARDRVVQSGRSKPMVVAKVQKVIHLKKYFFIHLNIC